MGKQPSHVNQIRRHHPDRSYEEIIDRVLDPYVYEYRGIGWKNDRDLSLKLNKCGSYVGHYIRMGLTHEQLIDRFLDTHHENKKTVRISGSYRNITWSNDRDLSRKLGKYCDYVYVTCKRHNVTREQLIDCVLDRNGKFSRED